MTVSQSVLLLYIFISFTFSLASSYIFCVVVVALFLRFLCILWTLMSEINYIQYNYKNKMFKMKQVLPSKRQHD